MYTCVCSSGPSMESLVFLPGAREFQQLQRPKTFPTGNHCLGKSQAFIVDSHQLTVVGDQILSRLKSVSVSFSTCTYWISFQCC